MQCLILFSLPALIIAATAELAGASVLHYDADYIRIAKITGQPIEWLSRRAPCNKPGFC